MVNGAIIDSPEDIDELLTANGYLDSHFVFVQAKRSSKFEGGEMAKIPDKHFSRNFDWHPDPQPLGYHQPVAQ